MYIYNYICITFFMLDFTIPPTHIKSKIRNIAIRIFGDGVHEKEELDILVVG